jgi:hypothetical protein
MAARIASKGYLMTTGYLVLDMLSIAENLKYQVKILKMIRK